MTTTRQLVLALVGVAAWVTPAIAGGIRGTLTDAGTHEPIIGATVVAWVADEPDTVVTVFSWADGAYQLELKPGVYGLTIYYDDTVTELSHVEVPAGADEDGFVHIDRAIKVPPHDYGCYFGPPTPPVYTGQPGAALTAAWTTLPIGVGRDHVRLAGLDARVAPARVITTVDGALRVPGSPAIATELLTDLAVETAQPAEGGRGASGGTALATLRAGTNQASRQLVVGVGNDARLVATVDGPVVRDHAWFATGAIVERRAPRGDAGATVAGQALASTSVIFSSGDGLATVRALATRTHADERDGWVDGWTRLRSDNWRREVTFGVTAQSLEAGATAARSTLDRLAARAAVRQRGRWRGWHAVTLGGEIGGGRVDDAAHRELSASITDSWDLRPNWGLTAGVRWDRRTAIGARTALLQPRLALVWDPTEEARAVVFASVERTSTLDDGPFASWRDGATFIDQGVVGLRREWRDRLVWSAAVRARSRDVIAGVRPEVGAEASADWLHRRSWDARLTVSTLERAATLVARWDRSFGQQALEAAVGARATVDDVAWTASARWSVRGFLSEHSLLSLGLDAIDLHDRATRSALGVLSISR